VFRDNLTPETRALELQHTVDPGFVNKRAIATVIGDNGIQLVDHLISQLPRLPDQLFEMRIAHVYTNVLLEFCKLHEIKTLGELLASGCGHMFCSTERLEPCENIYDVQRTKSVVVPAGQTDYQVILEYSTEHIFSDTQRMELHQGANLSVIATFRRRTANTLVFYPLVIGLPWLKDQNDPAIENWAMWYGHEYFEHFVEDFDEFSAVTNISQPNDVEPMRLIKEHAFKECLATLLGDTTRADWGGEMSDHYTAHLHLRGRRVTGAFLLKGPARFSPMTLNHLGKNNDQIYRLAQEPADVLVVQHSHEITSPVRATLRAFAVQPGRPRRYCCIDGRDSLRLLQAYGLYNRALELSGVNLRG
jgi:hypothetical protein